jgi:hypothetical protein
MKAQFYSLFMISFFLFISSHLFAQDGGLSVGLTKTNGNIYTVIDAEKHLLKFEISGIENAKQADDLITSVQKCRGVEEFTLQPIEGTNKWIAVAVLYKYAKDEYFKYFFGYMKVSEIFVDNKKTSVENL